MSTPPDVVARRLARAVSQVEQLENLIEDKSRELFLAAEEARSSRDALERLFDAVPGPVVVIDAAHRVKKFNRAALTFLNRLPLALSGEPVTDFFPDVVTSMALASTRTTPLEVSWVVDGTDVPVLLSITTFLDRDDTCAVLVATDLRDRKALEVELRQAQKLEAIGSLAAGIAHEVNTPLQFISDNVAFLIEAVTAFNAFALRIEHEAPAIWQRVSAEPAFEELPFFRAKIPKALGRVKQGLDRVTEIVGAMKGFAHPGGARGPVRLDTVVRRAVTVGGSELKNLTVEVKLEPHLVVSAYESDLNQVVLNLLVNAAHAIHDHKATHETPGRIVVTAVECGAELELRIEDDGGGIPQSIAHRVFDPFFTTKSVGRGTGQGLSICRKLVTERNGGRLWFDSVAGVGTTFHVVLPRDLGAAHGQPAHRLVG